MTAMEMSNPETWPLRSILPLTHKRDKDGQLPKLGCLVNGEGPVVFKGNMYDIVDAVREKCLEILSTQTYSNFKDLQKDWQID